jgi:hypothetical protein
MGAAGLVMATTQEVRRCCRGQADAHSVPAVSPMARLCPGKACTKRFACCPFLTEGSILPTRQVIDHFRSVLDPTAATYAKLVGSAGCVGCLRRLTAVQVQPTQPWPLRRPWTVSVEGRPPTASVRVAGRSMPCAELTAACAPPCPTRSCTPQSTCASRATRARAGCRTRCVVVAAGSGHAPRRTCGTSRSRPAACSCRASRRQHAPWPLPPRLPARPVAPCVTRTARPGCSIRDPCPHPRSLPCARMPPDGLERRGVPKGRLRGARRRDYAVHHTRAV